MSSITDRVSTRSPAPPLTSLRIRGFRSIVDLTLEPGPMMGLVGEAMAGKSNVLAAVHALLEPTAPVNEADATTFIEVPLELDATLAGRRVTLTGTGAATARTGTAPPVLLLPAAARSTTLAARPAHPSARRALALLRQALGEQLGGRRSDALPAASLVDGLERCCLAGISGLVLLVEEPELYLRPQAQRYLHRLLRTFAEAGNQVIYSTHSANLLSVGHLEELAFVTRAGAASEVFRPDPLATDDDLRALTEFDSTRSELFLAEAALLVEGATERLALPFAFAALGYDADREGVAIVECGGKGNIPLFARVCTAARVPFAVLHDRDRGDERLNALISGLAGHARAFVLRPDFEAATKTKRGGHKPARAWRRFATLERADLPAALVDAVETTVALARGARGERRRRA